MPRRPAPVVRHAAGCLLAGACTLAAAAGVEPRAAALPAAPQAGVPLVLLPDLKARIEERLAKVRAARAESGPASLAVTRPAAPLLAGAAKPVLADATAAKPAARPKAVPVAARPTATREWSYEGEHGPQAWGRLHPDYVTCDQGRRQSPIDLRGGISVDLEPIRFEHQPGAFRVVDTGRTVEVRVAPGNALTVGGRRYELQHFHFRRPSEVRIEGRQFAMDVQLVHRSEDGRVAIVAVPLEEGPAHPAVQQVWNHLPLEKHEEQLAPVPLDPGALLPEDRRYYAYMGSLTTPPCTEGVLWLVMQQPRTLSPAQQAIFAHLHPMNARPLQAAAGRLIKGSN